MKQTQKEISPPSKASKIIKRGLIASLLVIVAGTLFYVLVQRPLEIRMNRADFQRAETLIAQNAGLVEKDLGVTGSEVKKDCNYSSFGYEKGVRTCGVTAKFKLNKLSRDKANALSSEISKRYSAPIYGSYDGEVSSIAFTERDTHFGQSIEKFNQMLCSVGYDYTDESLLITLTCSAPAKAEFYPVVE